MDPKEKKVRATFKLFKNAVAKQLDKRFLELIDDETKGYFKRVKEAAASADRPTLEKHFKDTAYPQIDQLYIFSTRTLFRGQNIKELSFEDFMKQLLRHGLFREISKVEIVEVNLKQNEIAMADIVTKLNPKYSLGGRLLFIKDGDEWKIDMTSRHRQENNRIKAFCRYKSVDVDSMDCLNEFNKESGGFEIDESVIWDK